MIYLVTPEIIPPSRWKKFLRFFRLTKKRVEGELMLTYDGFSIGDVLNSSDNLLLIIGKK
jgi:hypothetical protein